MNCRLPGTKGKKLVYHPPRCSSGTNCSQTWLLSTWQAWLSSMSPLSLTSSPHAAILLPHGLLEPHNVGLCLPSISIFRQQVCSISLQPHEDVHEHMPKNTHVDSCKLGCDHSITSLSRQTSTDGKWLMCESLETLGTPWSHTGDDEEKKMFERKMSTSRLSGTPELHSLGLPLNSSNSKAENSHWYALCIRTLTWRAMSRSGLKPFYTIRARLVGGNLLISFQCRNSLWDWIFTTSILQMRIQRQCV